MWDGSFLNGGITRGGKNNILTIFGSFINVNHGEKTPLAGDLKPTSG